MNSNYEGWPTTRRYPRTMLEAFPDAVENAEWWHPPEKNYEPMNIALWMLAAFAWVGLAYYFANL